jgi:ribose 5-phosphate isomerase B
MKISVGTDHRGLEQKQMVSTIAEQLGHEVVDHGANSTDSCDYPDIAKVLGESVASGSTDLGILICGTGIGMSIAANKIKGIRAAVCNNTHQARLSREHNDANVLCIPGDSFEESAVREMVSAWLEAEFEGGRHARRVDKVKEMEERFGQ